MDKREELAACLQKVKGWSGLTADLLAAVFINEEAARRAFQTLSTKAREAVSGRGVAVVYGTLAHGVPALNVAGIICPLLDTKTNMRWLGDTTVEGLKGGPILRVQDQNLDQFGWPSSLLTVYDFVVVQTTSATPSTSSQPASKTPVGCPATTAPARQEGDSPQIGAATYTCGKCGREVYTTPAPSDTSPERLGATALYCSQCDDIVCMRCGSLRMDKGGSVPCGKCGGPARSIDDSHHPTWYPGRRLTSGNVAQKAKASTTGLLSAFSRDLTQAAMESQMDFGVMRENQLERVIHILCRDVRSNPILTGEPEIATACVVEALAKRIVQDNVPLLLRDRRILALDLSLLAAESNDWADFNRRLRSIVKEAEELRNVILLIDDLATLRSSAGTANVVKEALASGCLRCIGTAVRLETSKLIEQDPYLNRYFQEVRVPPPTKDECIRILSSIKCRLESFHALLYGDDALEASVVFAKSDVSDGSLLEKAIWLLDEAAARVRVKVSVRPDEILAAEVRIKSIVRRMENAIANHEFEKARSYSDEERKERENLRQLKEKYHIDDTVIGRVDGKDIEEAWASSHRVRLSTTKGAMASEQRGCRVGTEQ